MLGGAAQAQSAGGSDTSAAALRSQLQQLAANPTSVSELVQTGRTALAIGDGEGALGFFTRAEQLDGRDARVKAGLASANARTGRPETALQLFAEASALGAPEGEIAADRGLAYDLIGQTARAQQDYVASLRHREDAEVRRRLALSLAISGQRDAALRLIDAQAGQGDRAAARTRVMVLALSGDVSGATAAANSSLPAQASQAITPFLSRLASLAPGDMASAANLGRVPGIGIRSASARAGAPAADPAALAFAGGGTNSALSNRLPVALADSASLRRRPGGVTGAASAPVQSPIAAPARTLASSTARLPQVVAPSPATAAPTRIAASSGARMTEAATVSRPTLLPHPYEPLRLTASAATSVAAPVELAGMRDAGPRVPQAQLPAASTPEPVANVAREVVAAAAPVQLAVAQPEPVPEPQAVTQQPAAEVRVDGAQANLAVWNSGTVSAPATDVPESSATRPAFSDVVASVSTLPSERVPAPARTAPAAPRMASASDTARSRPNSGSRATTRTAAAAATSTARPPARSAPSRQTHPSRVWVQLGVSQNRAAFNYEITRMRRAAPELRNQTAHVAPIGSSHRLLVGPFPNEAAARTFINGLKDKDIPSLSWTSPAGTEVTRFTGR